MKLSTILLNALLILAITFLAALPLLLEYVSYQRDIKNKISSKRFRIAAFSVVYAIGITIALFFLKDAVRQIPGLGLIRWVVRKFSVLSRTTYFAELLTVIVLNVAIGAAFLVLVRFVRIGMKKRKNKKHENAKETDAQHKNLFHAAEKAIVRYFNKEEWVTVADVLRILNCILTAAYLLLLIVFQIPALYPANWIPYDFLSKLFRAGYLYPMITLLVLWEVYFFLSGVRRAEEECPELLADEAVEKADDAVDLETIDEEVRRQFADYYVCDIDLSEVMADKPVSAKHHANTLLIAEAVERDKRNPQVRKEIYLDCLDKLFKNDTSVLINGGLFTEFSMYFTRYLSTIAARGDNIVFVCNTDAEIESVYQYLKQSFSEISSLYCRNFESGTVDFDDPIWKIVCVKGEGDSVAEASVNEKSILVTSLRYLCSSQFEENHKQFIHLVDTIVFVDALETVNKYHRQMAMLNTKLRHITKMNAMIARNGVINKGFRIRYMSRQVRYICFDESRMAGLDKVLRNMLGVEFDSLDAMRFTPNALVRCYNYDGRTDQNGRVSSPQFVDSREEIGVVMNMAILCLANGAPSVSIFADGDIPYANIEESIAANMGRLSVTTDGNVIRLNKMFYNPNNYSVIIGMDHEDNLPKALRKYISMASDTKALIYVFSKPYMLRDYYYDNIDALWTNTQIGRIPVEEGTARDAAQKILIRANSGGISIKDIFKLCDGINRFDAAVKQKDVFQILAAILDIFNVSEEYTEPSGNHCGELRRILFKYFDYQPAHDFDESGRYYSEDRIYLRKHGKLFDMINGRDMAVLVLGEKEVVLPLPRSRISQNYIAGQNLIYNGAIYHINRIENDTGRIYVKLATSGRNNEVFRYIQERCYRLCIGGTDGKRIRNKHIILNRSAEGIEVNDAYYYVFRTPVEVTTNGYYEIDPHTLALNTAGSVYHSINDEGNDELARQTYRRYGKVDAPKYINCGMAYENKGALTMLISLAGDFGEHAEKMTALAAAMLNEVLRSMFPSVSDSVVVCPVADSAADEKERAFAGQPQLIVNGDHAILHKGNFELAIIEDSNTDLGVISTLFSAGDDLLATLFSPIYAYLKWYMSADKKSGYLYYGKNDEPECFDFKSLAVLSGLLGDNNHDLKIIDIAGMVERAECDFCGRAFRKGSQLNKVSDGRLMCDECAKTIVGSNKRALKTHIQAAKSFLESTYGIHFDKEYKICAESSERIIRALKAGGVDSRSAGIPLLAYMDRKKTVHAENGIPSENLTELLVRELVHIWQLQNLKDLSKELAEGLCAVVDVQYLRIMNRNRLADVRVKAYEKAFSPAAIGYKTLSEKLLLNPRFENNPFLYLLAYMKGEENERPAPPRTPIRIEDPTAFGKPYLPQKPDRAVNGKPAYFYYQRLTEKQRVLYDMLCRAIGEHAESVRGHQSTKEEAARVLDAIQYDHPELFWYKSALFSESEIRLVYGAGKEESELLSRQIEAMVPEYLQGIHDAMSAYDAAIRIYTKVLSATDYDTVALNEETKQDGPDPSKIDYLRTICGVFIRRAAVCEGYARAVVYLLQKCGIECAECAGMVVKRGGNDHAGSAHAWCIVKIDGAYYYLDPTWDDNSNTIQPVKHDTMDFDYFCVTTEELLRTRKIDLCPVEMPICSFVSANYYHHNALILDKYDLEKIKLFALDGVKQGTNRFSFKCSTKDVYRKAIEHLFGVTADAFPVVKAASKVNKSIDASKYTYSCNADLYTITIRFNTKTNKRNLLRSK